MKKNMYRIGLVILAALLSCGKENATPEAPINDDFDPDAATLLSAGDFIGVGHSVSGPAAVYDDNGEIVVLLDPFSTQNGPDLKVYLSKDEGASEYIRLGDLKSTNGKQSYTVPVDTNLGEYEYVHIWCEEFSVEFGRAKQLE